MTTQERSFAWRSILLPALLPALLFAIGEGAIIPIIPIVAEDLGGTLAVAGLVAALLTIGELIGNLPSGWLVSRIGERPAMIAATGTGLVGLAICLLAPNPVVLGGGVLLIGLATATFALARQAFLTSFVPIQYRARALSTLGGTMRLGFFVGPFLSAALIHLTGSAHSAFWIHVGGCIAAGLVLLMLADPTQSFGAAHAIRLGHRDSADSKGVAQQHRPGLLSTIRANRGVLLRVGSGAAIVSALRASRQVILPLWALSIGLGDAQTALLIGVAAGVDFTLFYLGGWIMDRHGRLWAALPATLGLAGGHLILATTRDLPSPVTWFVVAAIVLAIANGIGSGIIMTLGADLADRRDPAPFLGAFRFTVNVGGALSPLLLAGLTAAASIAVAAGAIGCLGLVGAALLARYIPRAVRPDP